jgi:hypothetical protein
LTEGQAVPPAFEKWALTPAVEGAKWVIFSAE